METMDTYAAAAKDVYLIINHPMYSAFGGFILFVILLRFYCRLTLGICECDEDMTGKTVLITGASAGIGKATAVDMARRNARVILACRNLAKTNKVIDEIKCLTGNQSVVFKCLDLCSFESVRKCAESVLQTEDKLHVLINNAGIAGQETAEYTEDGCDKVMQSNHFGHFLLTALLLDLLKKSAPSRIINVSSSLHKFSKLNLDDLKHQKLSTPLIGYCNSKLANVLFTVELSQRLSKTGVTVNVLHPGCVKTDVLQGNKSFFAFMTKIFFSVVGKTPEEGAQTTIYLAVHPELAQVTGKYFADCKEELLKENLVNANLAKRLFALSEETVGTSY